MWWPVSQRLLPPRDDKISRDGRPRGPRSEVAPGPSRGCPVPAALPHACRDAHPDFHSPLPGCGGMPRTRGVGGPPEPPSPQTLRHHTCFIIRSLPLNTLLCAAFCATKRPAAFLMVTWHVLYECRTDDLVTFFLRIVLVSNFLLL